MSENCTILTDLKEDYISLLTKDFEFTEDMFNDIYDSKCGEFKINQYLDKMEEKCVELKIASKFRKYHKFIKKERNRIARENKRAEYGDSFMTEFQGAPLQLRSGDYECNDRGIFIEKAVGEHTFLKCVTYQPVIMDAMLTNMENGSEKVRIAFKDNEHMWKKIIVNKSEVSSRSGLIKLTDRGLVTNDNNVKDMIDYFFTLERYNQYEIPYLKCVSHLGWVGDNFLPYSESANDTDEDAIYFDGGADVERIHNAVTQKGDYKLWKQHTTDLREKLPIRLAMDASFSAPLVGKIGTLSYILHLWGTTEFGKTVTLQVCSSIWGDPRMDRLTFSMKNTMTHMAVVASTLRNIPFCADELQQIKLNGNLNYDNLIMLLTEGADKGRGTASGGIRDSRTWNTSFIFTGEEKITKESSGGGAQNRCIEIGVDNEEDEKLIKDGSYTVPLVENNYGYAGKDFVEYITNIDKEKMVADYRSLVAEIQEKTETTGKQASSMALILLADRYACECIYENGKPLKVEDVQQYLKTKEEVDISERAYKWLLDFVTVNSIRFTDDRDVNKGCIWGKVDSIREEVAIIPQVLKDEMSKAGYSYDACKKKWDKNGYILKDARGKFSQSIRIEGKVVSAIKIKIPPEMAGNTDVLPIGDNVVPFDASFTETEEPTPFDEVAEQQVLSLTK